MYYIMRAVGESKDRYLGWAVFGHVDKLKHILGCFGILHLTIEVN